MPDLSTCPADRDLQRLLLGQLPRPEAEPLEVHLAVCARCATLAPALKIEDGLLEAVRTATEAPLEEADKVLVAGLARRLKELPPPHSAAGGDTQDIPAPVAAAPPGAAALGCIGAYRLCQVLGSGGMGVVFQAEDPHLRRFVALKAMKPSLAVSTTARQRFLREAQLTAAVKHDHIVTIHQVGEERGVPFLAMELLEGETLEQRLQREQRDGEAAPLPPAEVLRIGREIAEGLAAAHARGLIHRDVKPANVWLEGPRGRVKLLDFGLAWAAEQDVALTQTGAIVGTPAYMAPEQARGESADPRSDLFSLGCVLYRMCTGRPPFRGATTSALLLAVALEQPPRADEINPLVPPALAALVARLMAKEPARRPASAAEVIAFLDGIRVPDASPDRKRRPVRGRHPWLAWSALALVAGAVVLGALFSLRGERKPVPGQQAPQPDLGPLDRLSADRIPPTARFDGQPEELVALAGSDSTSRNGPGGSAPWRLPPAAATSSRAGTAARRRCATWKPGRKWSCWRAPGTWCTAWPSPPTGAA
jgi:serine/threonine protein kinase